MLLSSALAPRKISPVLDSSTVVPPIVPSQPPLSFLARPSPAATLARFEPPPSNAPKPPAIPCDKVRAYGEIRSRIKFVPMSLRAVLSDFVLPIKKLKKPSSTVFCILETVSAQEFFMSLKAVLTVFTSLATDFLKSSSFFFSHLSANSFPNSFISF